MVSLYNKYSATYNTHPQRTKVWHLMMQYLKNTSGKQMGMWQQLYTSQVLMVLMCHTDSFYFIKFLHTFWSINKWATAPAHKNDTNIGPQAHTQNRDNSFFWFQFIQYLHGFLIIFLIAGILKDNHLSFICSIFLHKSSIITFKFQLCTPQPNMSVHMSPLSQSISLCATTTG